MDRYDFVVALAGNPNTGKSTLFNSLTGLRQHTGNWPGKTVTRAEGGFAYQGSHYKLVDLPGTYSLLSTSTDEEIARDFMLFGQPDVTVIVVDATRLERNLNLVFQVLEITGRAVVCLNLMDEAERHHLTVEDRSLARELGVPVVPTAARQGRGIPQLIDMVHQVATGKLVCKPHRIRASPRRSNGRFACWWRNCRRPFPVYPISAGWPLRLLEGDSRIEEAVRSGELAGLARGADGAGVAVPAERVG